MKIQDQKSANTSVTDIAKALVLMPRRVQQLAKDGALPAPINGKYDLI